jgi:AcrR family transcriptional regulator
MARIVKKPAERKLEIIKAAAYLFRNNQYDKTSMQDIMDYVGITKGAIYHYFESKEELLEAVIEDIVKTNVAQTEKIIQKSKGNAIEKIRFVSDASNIAHDNQNILNYLHRSNDIMHIRVLIATLINLIPLNEKLIIQGCDEGIFQTDNPLECAEFILFAVQFLTDIGIHSWKQEEINRRARAFPRLIEKMLSSPSGSFNFILKHMIKS